MKQDAATAPGKGDQVKSMKTLGLTTLAAVLIGAFVGTAAAAAARFTAEQYPATISSKPTASQQVTTETWDAECDPSGLSGELSGASSSLTATATDVSCSISGGDMKFHNCKLIFHPGSEGVGAGTMEVGPSNCEGITFSSISWSCQVTIVPQTGLAASYKATGSGSSAGVEVSLSATGVKYKQVSGSGCAHGERSDGTWIASWPITATHSGTADGLRVVKPSIAVEGDGVKTAPSLHANAYPTALVGSQGAAWSEWLTYHFAGGKVECETVSASGNLVSASASISMSPSFAECFFAEVIESTIVPNGCTYGLTVANQPPSNGRYGASMAISCPAGKEIEVVTHLNGVTKCTQWIPSQTPSGEVTLENQAGGTVAAHISLTGLKYKQQAGSGLGACVASGEYTNGTYSGVLDLAGE